MDYEQTHTKRYQYRRMGLVPIKQSKDAETGLYGVVAVLLIMAMVALPALLNLG